MPKNPLANYIAPFQPPGGWWRPVAGMIIILGSRIIGTILVVFGWPAVEWVIAGELHLAVENLAMLGAGGGTQAVVVMLLSFVGIWAGVAITTNVLHDRGIGRLFDPESRIRWGDFASGLAIAVVFSALSLIAASLLIEAPVRAQAVSGWAIMFLPLVLLIFIQATAEELIFRGYLLQQLAIRFRSPFAWAILPAMLFGVLHAANAPGVAGMYYMAITAITGITLAALVWRTGNLWAAVGMHLGVNVISLTGVGAEGILSGTQLWLYPGEALMPLLQVDLGTSIVLLALVLSPAGRLLRPRRGPAVI